MIEISIDRPQDIEKGLSAFHIAVGAQIVKGIEGLESLDVVWRDPADKSADPLRVHLAIK